MTPSRWILPLLLATTLPTGAVAQDQGGAQDLNGAKTFVSSLYAGYGHFPKPAYENRDVFAPPLLAAIRKDMAGGEIGVLEWDPICDCQDDGGMTLSDLKLAPNGPGKAKADITLHWDQGESRALTLDLAVTPAGWRVSDVHTRATPSLLTLLSRRR